MPRPSQPTHQGSAPPELPAGTSQPGPAPDEPAVVAVELTKVHGSGRTEVRAVDGVSLRVQAGSLTAIMGQSGSGKSTLMHCLAGLDQVTSGRVVLGGQELTGLDDTRLTRFRRRHVGFVFQSFNLLPTLTARQNITLPLELAGQRADGTRLEAVAASLGLLDRLDHRPSELSGGQQQRVAIARAVLARPTVVFADEPTGALDRRSGEDVLGHLRDSVDRLGQTVVMVTHDPVAAGWADRVLVMADGRVVADLDRPDRASLLRAIDPEDTRTEDARTEDARTEDAGTEDAGESR